MHEHYASRAESWDRLANNKPPLLATELLISALDSTGGCNTLETAYAEGVLHPPVESKAQTSTEKLVVLDLGCGTGRVGELLGSQIEAIDGVDISSEMLSKAKSKGIYRKLHEANLADFLSQNTHRYDAIIAAASLIYFSDLRRILSLARESLTERGLMVFTVLEGSNAHGPTIAVFHGWPMDGCFSHSRTYVEQIARETGYETLRLESRTHETDRLSRPIPGLVAALRRS